MYNSYFGFQESPFNVTPDPRFFYTNPVYQEAFAVLRYGIEAKKGFVVITGEVGTGKTTLLRKLMRSLGETIHSVFIFNTLLSFPELLQLILHDLGLASGEPNKVTMLQELNDYLMKQLKQGHIVSVLIDEAQNLSDEALEGLRLLSNLETDQEKLLQFVLLGQPELMAKLDQPGLRQVKQRVAFQCQLAPLRDEETGPYIDFRLRAVGYTGNDLFEPDAVRRIAFYSRGIPRLINTVCDNALLSAYAESKKIISADMIQEVGRDLRLESKAEVAHRGNHSQGVGIQEMNVFDSLHETPDQARSRGIRLTLRGGVRGAIVILVLLALAAVVDPQNLIRTATTRLETSKHNLSQWGALVTYQPVLPEEVIAETKREVEVKIETDSKPQRVVIQNGSTILKIIGETYGAKNFLALDMVKESNPQIKNLNWVFPGQELLLPPLSHETMLRKQTDGSYRLIAGSFPSLAEADRYARLLGNKGYHAVITPKRVSDDLLLHRVEIQGLKTLQEANDVWDIGLRNQWLALVGNSSTGQR
jgi:general secretion pathway protein A